MSLLQRRFESVTRRREKAIARFQQECKDVLRIGALDAHHVAGVAAAIDDLRRADAEFEAWKEAIETAKADAVD